MHEHVQTKYFNNKNLIYNLQILFIIISINVMIEWKKRKPTRSKYNLMFLLINSLYDYILYTYMYKLFCIIIYYKERKYIYIYKQI